MNVQLPKNTIDAIMRSKTCSKQFQESQDTKIVLADETVDLFKNTIGIKNMDSAFVQFYAVVGFPPENDNSPELSTLNEVLNNSTPDGFFAEYFQNSPDIAAMFGKRFFVLTSGEEEGFFFYDSETDAVHDTDNFILTKHYETMPDPKWKTFYDFIESYYGKGIYHA